MLIHLLLILISGENYFCARALGKIPNVVGSIPITVRHIFPVWLTPQTALLCRINFASNQQGTITDYCLMLPS